MVIWSGSDLISDQIFFQKEQNFISWSASLLKHWLLILCVPSSTYKNVSRINNSILLKNLLVLSFLLKSYPHKEEGTEATKNEDEIY